MSNRGRDFLIYLAGPISGLTYDEGQGWRDFVALQLPQEIRCMSPLRAKADQLNSVGVIKASYENHPLTSQMGITTRDRFDVMRADAVLFNFLGAETVSIGTVMEVAWADAFRKPIVLVMENDANIHDHPMVRAVSGFRVDNLDDAVEVLTSILMPEGYGTRREDDVLTHSVLLAVGRG